MYSRTFKMALLRASWILSLVIASLSVQLSSGEGTSGFLPVPTPTPTPTLLSYLQEYAVEFTILSTTLDEWANTSLVFKETVAEEITIYCGAYPTECNLQTDNSTLNFTANTMEVQYLEVSGSSLELVVVVHIPSTTSLLPQEALGNILLGASSSIYQATGKIVTEITLYTLPLSTSLLLAPTPTPTPTSTPFPIITPTPVPSPPAYSVPTLQERQEHSVLLILSHISIEEWNAQLEQVFKVTVAEQATQYCSSNPTACGLQPESRKRRDSHTVVFTPAEVLLLPGYPRTTAIGNSLEVGFGLSFPDLSAGLVPQATLLSISLEMSPTLAERTGTYVVGISVWVAEPEERGLAAILGTAIPATLILLLFTALTVWLLVMYNRARKAMARYDLGNYIATDDPDIQLISYKTLPLDTE